MSRQHEIKRVRHLSTTASRPMEKGKLMVYNKPTISVLTRMLIVLKTCYNSALLQDISFNITRLIMSVLDFSILIVPSLFSLLHETRGQGRERIEVRKDKLILYGMHRFSSAFMHIVNQFRPAQGVWE